MEDALAIANLHADSWRSTYRGILRDDYLDRHAHVERRLAWQTRFSQVTPKMFVLVADGTKELAPLWLIEQNFRARRFYERAGAVVAGSASNPMPDGQTIRALRCYWPTLANLIL